MKVLNRFVVRPHPRYDTDYQVVDLERCSGGKPHVVIDRFGYKSEAKVMAKKLNAFNVDLELLRYVLDGEKR